jgi:hypothetical protein
MTDDFVAAVVTYGSQLVYGAFKAIEYVFAACCDYLEGLVIIIAAYFTCWHNLPPLVTLGFSGRRPPLEGAKGIF